MEINKQHWLGISVLLVVLFSLGGYFYWRYNYITCCEPPLSLSQENDEVAPQSLTGNWTYFNRDAEGYSSGIDVTINQVDKKIAGEFTIVWSFPKAPAARLNNGNFQGELSSETQALARVEWLGSRDDSGVAEIRYLADKQALEWRTIKSSASDVTMPDSVILFRNRWTDLSLLEQKALAAVADEALKKIPGMENGGIEIEMTTVVGSRAKVWFYSADGEESGALFLEQNGSTWRSIPEPESGSISG